MKRNNHVMLRLSDEEHRLLLAAKPDGQNHAAFARAALVEDAKVDRSAAALRRVASFIVASLSPEITFEEALVLFDEHVPNDREEAIHGGGH
jgi:hypothetical protein